jgi:tetratricopeptide (TPR) repeat protein
MEKTKPNPPQDSKAAAKAASAPVPPPAPVKVAPMFRPTDWLTLAITFGVIWVIYLFTLAPEQTLEDSGELCTGAFYAGIPHPPGYPFWSVYAWFWTAILPFGNVAWRVEVGESFAAAMGCGLLALMVSRGSSMLIEGIDAIKNLPRQWENAICSVSGFVAGTLLGLDVFMWSESVVINRISLFGVPWLIAVLACLLRWMYAPQQRRYLYLAMFLYGLCATIHQTLLLSAMGVEVAIALASPRLGRDLFAANSVIYLCGQMLMGTVPALQNMSSIEVDLFNIVGVGSLLACVWLVTLTKRLGSEIWTVVLMGIVWAVGVSVYFYEPISGMTDPPMQWGYPRTVEGFFHALSRGQYESIDHKFSFRMFLFQLGYIVQGLSESFSWVYVIIGLLPFAFLLKMHKRERSWIIGLVAVYLCLSVLLVILINVSPDRSSTDLNKVFFTASHGLFALMIGYGLTLLAAYTATHYQKVRPWGIAGGAVAALLAIFLCLKDAAGKLYYGPAGTIDLFQLPHAIAMAFDRDQYALPIFANLILLAIPLCLIAAFLAYRQRGPVLIMLVLFSAMPLWSGLSHWYKSEQRNHWFGFWFGHDMFTPPFTDPQTGKLSYDNDLRATLLKNPANATLVYPEMDRNTILFGGTDPGRFCPTYSIFCDSFIPHRCQPKQDQKFDRRDCYLITQNALADGTYLDYLRAQYNRSQQHDPPFFSELSKYLFSLGTHAWRKAMGSAYDRDVKNEPDQQAKAIMIQSENNACDQIADSGLFHWVNICLSYTLDGPFTAWGAYVEKYRRARGVYPPSEIYIPSPQDSQQCFEDYQQDVARRQPLGQLKPGEDVHFENGHMQVSGQVAVMTINGLLCKVIFDHNPTNSFYVEESFPLDWMYPYESPFGIIMKINRNPLPELSDDVFKLDHQFWTQYSTRLCGNWINYDTSVQQIADFVKRTYIHNNYQGYTGDRAFVRDDDAQKAFSKLRSSQAGMYYWRMSPACPPEYRQKTAAGQQALIRETEFAFKQSFAFCPYSPEAVYRYVNFLLQMAQGEEMASHPQQAAHYFDDAILVGETCKQLDPYNESITDLINNVKTFKAQISGHAEALNQALSQMEAMESTARTNPANVQNLVTLGAGYIQMQQNGRAQEMFDLALTRPEISFGQAATIEQYCGQIGDHARVESAAKKVISLAPNPLTAQNDVVLAGAYLQLNQTSPAAELLDTALASPDIAFSDAAAAAQYLAQMNNFPKLETAIQKLVSLAPNQPEPRYDLAALQAILGKSTEALQNLKTSLDMSAQRLAQNPAARDLLAAARTDQRLDRLRALPEFQKLVPPK